MGEKRGQDLRKVGKPSKGSQEGDNGRLREADAPSNKGKQEGVQWETQGNKTLRKGARHPTKGNKKGYNGGQAETRPSGRRTHHPTKGNKKRYNGRQEG